MFLEIFEYIKNFFDFLAKYFPVLISLYIGFLIGWVWGVGLEREKFDRIFSVIINNSKIKRSK